MTRDEARAYFAAKGLTYHDIIVSDLHYLCLLLDERFIAQRKERTKDGRKPLYWNRTNSAKYYKGEFVPDVDGHAHLARAFITAKGEYFTAREVVSFEPNGFIGLCGEADDENKVPVLEAFIERCDWLAERKEQP